MQGITKQKDTELKLGKRIKATAVSGFKTVEGSANAVSDGIELVGSTIEVLHDNLQEIRLEQKLEIAKKYQEVVEYLKGQGYKDNEIHEFLSR